MFEELKETIQAVAKEDYIAGYHLATLTGEVLEEDGTYVEVMLNGNSFYAKPCFPLGVFNVPTKEFINKIKDKFGAWVCYEDGSPSIPIWVGMCPFDNKTPTTNDFQYSAFFDTEKWTFRVNDEKEQLEIIGENGAKINIEKGDITIDNGENSLIEIGNSGTRIKVGSNEIFISKTKIEIGGSSVPMVKGTQLISIMNELLTAIETLTVTTPAGLSTVPLNIPVFEGVRAKLNSMLNQQVTM